MKRGCAVACKICPQTLLSSKYQSGIRFLSLSDFTRVLHKIPKTYRVDFSGYSEPFLNKDCAKMMQYTSDQGYYFCCYTTLVGASLEDIDTLSALKFSRKNNCPLNIHLPDEEGVMPISITSSYKQVIRKLFDLELPFVDWMTMNKNGNLHPEIKDLLGIKINNFLPATRANNLKDGDNMKEGEVKNVARIDGPITCRPMPELNHNVMLPNGDVHLCCMDYGLKHKLGNLFDADHVGLFSGDEFLRLRKQMKEDMGKSQQDILCRNCEFAIHAE